MVERILEAEKSRGKKWATSREDPFSSSEKAKRLELDFILDFKSKIAARVKYTAALRRPLLMAAYQRKEDAEFEFVASVFSTPNRLVRYDESFFKKLGTSAATSRSIIEKSLKHMCTTKVVQRAIETGMMTSEYIDRSIVAFVKTVRKNYGDYYPPHSPKAYTLDFGKVYACSYFVPVFKFSEDEADSPMTWKMRIFFSYRGKSIFTNW